MTDHQTNGWTCVSYSNGDSEVLHLKHTRWQLTRKGGRYFLPHGSMPPNYPLKKLREEVSKTKYCQSGPHLVKDFADDLSVLSQSLHDHCEALARVDSCCTDLGLELHPNKCVTLVIIRER